MNVDIPTYASKIDLSNMGLTEVPPEIFGCKNLRKLNLSNNKIKEIPQELSKLKLLTNLDLSHNQLSVLFSKNFNFPRLEVLTLNKNNIRSLPKQIGHQKTLRALSLAHNNLENLPEEFAALKNLTSLNIAHNLFRKFPEAILKLPLLKTLWLNGNSLDDFPISEMSIQLKSLKKLYCFSAITTQVDHVNEGFKHLQRIRGNSYSNLKLLGINKERSDPPSLTKRNEIQMQDTQNNIFISYCHSDSEWLGRVQVALKALHFEGLRIDIWDDRRIKAGTIWKEEIEKAINNASIAIMLVSMDFLASGFIREKEVPPFLEKAKNKGVVILPVIIGWCRFTQSPVGIYQAVNDPNRPLNTITKPEQDKVFYDLAEEIHTRLKGA